MYIHVYVSDGDKELVEWLCRLKRDNIVVTATIRDILRTHIRGERKLTEESIAVAVVRRLREDGLVLIGPVDSGEDQASLVEAALWSAAEEFVNEAV